MKALGQGGVFHFEGFRLDRQARVLLRRDKAGAFVPMVVGSRALEVLDVLLVQAGNLVSRDELMTAVWPATAVEDTNLNMQIATLRRILDEGRTEGSYIQTIPGHGYRFTAPVTPVAADAATLLPSGPPPLPDKPSIAVMPFQNMSGDPEQEYFADGLVEEIITALSRIRWLFVIARNSSFTYKGQAVDVKQVGRELGVRYILEGAIRKAGGRVRISAQLIDAATGAHLWAERFDGLPEDIFELQDQVAASAAGVIEPTLQAAETTRSADRPTRDLAAFDLYLRALHHFNHFDRSSLIRGLGLLEQAIERDPDYGAALALAAHCHQRFAVANWTDDPEAARRTSIEFARRALRNSPNDPEVLRIAAFVPGYFGEDIEVSLNLIDRCLALNPSFARGWYSSGLLRFFCWPTRARARTLQKLSAFQSA
jgi:TolB-like protein